MALYNEVLPEFQRFNAELLGISVDGVWCHAAFSRPHEEQFELDSYLHVSNLLAVMQSKGRRALQSSTQ